MQLKQIRKYVAGAFAGILTFAAGLFVGLYLTNDHWYDKWEAISPPSMIYENLVPYAELDTPSTIDKAVQSIDFFCIDDEPSPAQLDKLRSAIAHFLTARFVVTVPFALRQRWDAENEDVLPATTLASDELGSCQPVGQSPGPPSEHDIRARWLRGLRPKPGHYLKQMMQAGYEVTSEERVLAQWYAYARNILGCMDHELPSEGSESERLTELVAFIEDSLAQPRFDELVPIRISLDSQAWPAVIWEAPAREIPRSSVPYLESDRLYPQAWELSAQYNYQIMMRPDRGGRDTIVPWCRVGFIMRHKDGRSYPHQLLLCWDPGWNDWTIREYRVPLINEYPYTLPW